MAWYWKLVPTALLRLITAAFGWVAARRWLVAPLVAFWKWRYRPDLAESQPPPPGGWPDFNAFFTRALKPGVRDLAPDPQALKCPCDGTLEAFGTVGDGTPLPVKGRGLSVQSLLGGADWAQQLDGAHWAVIYLAPRDYHRVHLSLAGQLVSWAQLPGSLYPVNPAAAAAIPDLYCRNARAACRFATQQGPLVQVMVGALIVGGIALAWEDRLAPAPPGQWRDNDGSVPALAQMDQMGMFRIGSTLVLLQKGSLTWEKSLRPGQPVRLGEPLGRFAAPA